MISDIRTLLISPHSDDIALSLGGSLISNFFEGPAMMVTVFTESNFSPGMKLNGSKIISNQRYLEDLAFAKAVGLELLSLDYPEPPMRGKCSSTEIFSNDNPEFDPIFKNVHNNLSDIIRSHPAALVLSPMGLTNHIDHLIVLRSCLLNFKENNIKIAFYEDVPYAANLTSIQIKSKADLLSYELKRDLVSNNINITEKFNDKIKYLKLYKTQIGNKVTYRIRAHSARLGSNKKLLDSLWKYKIFRYLFSYGTYIHGDFFERIWLVEKK